MEIFLRAGKLRNSSLPNWKAGERDLALVKMILSRKERRVVIVPWGHTGVLGLEPDLAGKAARVEPPSGLLSLGEQRMTLFRKARG